MSERTDLLYRLRELQSNSHAHRLMETSARRLIAAGNLAGATTVIDDLELALHPALAAGGGGGSPLAGLHIEKGYPDSQDLVSGVATPVTFNFLTFDPHGFYDPDTGVVTVPQAFGGWWTGWLSVVFDSNAVGYRQVQFENSQGFNTPSLSVPAISGAANEVVVPFTGPLSFEEDDYIIPLARQTSGDVMPIGDATLVLVRLGDWT